MVDEFSCALSNNALTNESDKMAARNTFCTGQMETYANATAGWSFWSYKTEYCANDNDWCFKNAVGRSLPNSFFSYPGNYPSQPSPGSISPSNPIIIPGILSPVSPIVAALKAIPIPASSTVLAYANPMPLSGGDALAALEQNLIVPSSVDVNLQVPYLGGGGAPQQAPASSSPSPAPASSDDSTASDPSASAEDVSTASTDSLDPSDPTASSTLSKRGQQASFVAPRLPPGKFAARQIRELVARKQASSSNQASMMSGSSGMTPTQVATAKGYSDGFQTAKVFALSSGSRLGFTDQYIADSLAALVNTNAGSQQQQLYTEWFLRGLADGESQVATVLAKGDEAGTILVAVAGTAQPDDADVGADDSTSD